MKIYTKSKNKLLISKLKKLFCKALIETNNDILNIAVGLKFVSEEEIQKLNNMHRGIDKVTDVLSFPMLEIKAGQKVEKAISQLDLVDGEVYLGDIVICKNKLYEQAKQYNHSKKKEMCYLALHSFLHLLGYDHMTKAQEKKMFGLAEKILGYER